MGRVVIDANFSSRRGRFDKSRLERLSAKLSGTGVTFVVPEVVVWEWAEHAALDYAELLRVVEELRPDDVLVGAPALLPSPTIDEFVDRIRTSLPAGYQVVDSHAEDYRNAVRAQVLQLGAGERKEGVKTGAADELIRSCVAGQIKDRDAMEAVVLATGDKHLQSVCEREFGDELIVAKDQRALINRLIEFVPASDELLERLEADLRLTLGNEDVSGQLLRFATGFTIVSRRSPASPFDRERLRLVNVEIVELEDLRVEVGEAGERLGVAEARIFGSVELDVSTVEMFGDPDDGDFERVPVWHGKMNAMIDVALTMNFDADWNVTWLEPAGRATVDFS